MSPDLDDLAEELAEFDDLHLLITRSLADVDVPARRLRDRAVLDGRRLRRRRTVAVIGGLAAAAVAAFALPLVGGSGTTATDHGFAGSSTGTPTATEPRPFVAKPGYWDMPATEMAGRLSALLPRRVALSSFQVETYDRAPGESRELIGDLPGTLAGPTGPGSVEVMLVQLSDEEMRYGAATDGSHWGDQDLGCPPELGSPGVQVRTCALKSDPAGRVVQRELEVIHDGVTEREVKIVTNGGIVYVATANSTQRKRTGPPSASRNPLTLDQVARIATSSAWTDWSGAGR